MEKEPKHYLKIFCCKTREYEKEYKEALYKAQKTDDVSFLVEVFSKCQKRLDEKMIDYKNTIDLVKREIENEDR